jgi:hypothetical protein
LEEVIELDDVGVGRACPEDLNLLLQHVEVLGGDVGLVDLLDCKLHGRTVDLSWWRLL